MLPINTRSSTPKPPRGLRVVQPITGITVLCSLPYPLQNEKRQYRGVLGKS